MFSPVPTFLAVRLAVLLAFTLFSINSFAQPPDSVIRKSVYFGGGSYFIDHYQVGEVIEFLESVKGIEKYEIGVFSHTDNIGGQEYNQWLARRRSESVIRILESNMIPREIIKTKDWGQANPLYSNESHEGRVMNRRVDIVLWPITF